MLIIGMNDHECKIITFPLFMSHVVDYVYYKSKWTVNGYEIYIYVLYVFNFCGIGEKNAEINIYRNEIKLYLILPYA